MRSRRISRVGTLLFLGVILVLIVAACAPSQPAGPKIVIENVWARPTRAGMGSKVTSAAYMIIKNEGNEADRLVGVMSDVAEHVEIHQSVMEGNVMKMRPVEGGLEIPAKGQVELKPGGYHVMLIGVKQPLKPGDRFTLILEFEKSGKKTLQVEVKEM